MTGVIILGLFVALAAGIAIGTQSTITSRIGTLIGSFRTGVMVNLAGGLVAALIFAILLIVKGNGFWQFPPSTLVLVPIAGDNWHTGYHRCGFFTSAYRGGRRVGNPYPRTDGGIGHR